MADQLEPLDPAEGVSMFLRHRAQELEPHTSDAYRLKLDYFCDYAETRGIDNLNDLTGRDIEQYRVWRREESTGKQLATKTMRDDMYLLRDMLRYLGSIEAVPADLYEKVNVPQLGPKDGVRDVQLTAERAREIITYLDKFAYASLEHVVWLLFAATGERTGGLYALDVEDYHPAVENPHLTLRHRPDQGTRLKNGIASERNVNLGETVCKVLDDYLDSTRPTATDEHGRRPLLATNHGRLSKSTMQKYVYKWSRPCEVTDDCPDGRTIADCEAAQDAHQASKCPWSRSPHAIRHGYISKMRDTGVPKAVLSDRCDVSEEIIDKHYDERTEVEKQDLRKRVFEEILDEENAGYID